jgi:hypothetical protein
MKYIITQTELDPLQFAYRPKRGTQDAVLCLTDFVIRHLNKEPGNYARCLFIDFTSAFNTVQPSLLYGILLSKGIEPKVAAWLYSFLTDRRQFVESDGSTSVTATTNTGTPQGSVISPLLFSLYIDQLRSDQETVRIFKYADDLAITGLCGKSNKGISEYIDVVDTIVSTCSQLHLLLNHKKTKEMVFTVSRQGVITSPIQINNNTIEVVDKFKYLGTIITPDLNFELNCESRLQKARKRLHLLSKLRYAKADISTLKTIYSAFISSVLFYHLDLYFNHLTQATLAKLDRLTRTASKIANHQFDSCTKQLQMKQKSLILSIYLDNEHPFNFDTISLPSGRLQNLKVRIKKAKQCFRHDFIFTINDIIFSR